MKWYSGGKPDSPSIQALCFTASEPFGVHNSSSFAAEVKFVDSPTTMKISERSTVAVIVRLGFFAETCVTAWRTFLIGFWRALMSLVHLAEQTSGLVAALSWRGNCELELLLLVLEQLCSFPGEIDGKGGVISRYEHRARQTRSSFLFHSACTFWFVVYYGFFFSWINIFIKFLLLHCIFHRILMTRGDVWYQSELKGARLNDFKAKLVSAISADRVLPSFNQFNWSI